MLTGVRDGAVHHPVSLPSSSGICSVALRLPQLRPSKPLLHKGLHRRVHVSSLTTAAPAEETPFGPEDVERAREFLASDEAVYKLAASWMPPERATSTAPSITDTGTLMPAAEWFPAWMKYRKREDNYVFWEDKFNRCSLKIPPEEQRCTLFSILWYPFMEARFMMVPPALRYLMYLSWRQVMFRLYYAHRALVLWQAKLDAHLASEATGGRVKTFSKAMALRRLHWKNSLLGELTYLIQLWQTGRVHSLPPKKEPWQRPTFWIFF